MKELIKELIHNIKDVEKKDVEERIYSNLQILSTTKDLSIFDPGSIEVAELYSVLYNLLIKKSPDSEIVWRVLQVIDVVIRNPRACATLIQSYNFILPLTLLLDNQLEFDKKFTLLKITQELSYGVEIRWQEAHLPKLMKILLDIVKSKDSELIPLALGVIVNVCHKNKPAVYCLMHIEDTKAFLRTLLNLKSENTQLKVLTCKLVMILNQLSKSVQDSEILTFVRVSFSSINDAFKVGNYLLMRHIVDFFKDAKQSEHGRQVLLTYAKYNEDTNNLIMTLSSKEVGENWECVEQVIALMQQLAELEVEEMLAVMPRLMVSVLPWVKVPQVAASTLRLLSTLLAHTSHANHYTYEDLCSLMERNLEMLVLMLHSHCRQEGRSGEDQETLTELFHLLSELATNSNLTSAIAVAVDIEELKTLLLPLMTCKGETCNLYHQPGLELYAEVLSLVSKLSLDDKEWLFWYSDILEKEQILKALAVSLYSGSYQIKRTILYLAGTTSFSKASLSLLAKCLSELNHLYPCTGSNKRDNDTLCQSPYTQDSTLLFTSANKEALNALIDRLDQLISSNQLHKGSLTGIIDLYNYKLREMRQTEQTLQRSLGAADYHRNHLEQKVVQLSSESNRLHQVLYTGQQSLEASQQEVANLQAQLVTARAFEIKFKQLKQDIQSKSLIIKDQTEEISKMKTIIEAHEKAIQNHETTNADLNSTNTKLEEKLRLREKEIAEQNTLISNQQNQLLDLERMRKVIFDITGGKKNLQ